MQNPDGSSADELTAVDTQRGTDTMPDTLDVGPSFAQQAIEEGKWDPYQPTTWDEIPDNLKDPDGNWVGSFYGIMAVGVNTTLVEKCRRRSPISTTRSTPARWRSTAILVKPVRRSPR